MGSKAAQEKKMTKLEYLTHDIMDNYYADIIRKLSKDCIKPDVVFAPMRGGADFGIKVSNYYDIPFESFQWQTRSGQEKNAEYLIELLNKHKSKLILIVDDICDTGYTFKCVAEIVDRFNIDKAQSDFTVVLFAAAIENLECDFECDYSSREINRSDDNQWFVFPWESWWRR